MNRPSAAALMALCAVTACALVIIVMVLRATMYPSPDHSFSMPLVAWAVLIAAVGCAALAVVFFGYSVYLRSSAHRGSPAPEASPEPVLERAGEADAASEPEEEPDLTRLTDDERQLYDIISKGGGEVLQKDLVASGVFSKSKVTRLLDKLERRGLIRRERHGMTNRVLLTDEG